MSLNKPQVGEVFEFRDFDNIPTQMIVVDTSATHIEYRIENHRQPHPMTRQTWKRNKKNHRYIETIENIDEWKNSEIVRE